MLLLYLTYICHIFDMGLSGRNVGEWRGVNMALFFVGAS